MLSDGGTRLCPRPAHPQGLAVASRHSGDCPQSHAARPRYLERRRFSPDSTISKYGLLEREELASLEKAGVVGNVLCWFIDADGNILDHPVNERVVAVDPRNLKGTRKIVLASGGWQKYASIRGALKLLHPQVLVTDEVVAERLVAE